MSICCLSPLPGQAPGDLKSMAELVVRESLAARERGTTVVLWPEYLWSFCSDRAEASPELMQALLAPVSHDDLFVLAGTLELSSSNTALIINQGQWHTQSKIALGPLESSMNPGSSITIFTFKNLRIATLVCMDVEMPELSSILKDEGIDLLLVPARVEDAEGLRRITICAEARSIELGCYSAVCPLLGTLPAQKEASIGNILFFHPAQQAFSQALPPLVKEFSGILRGTCPIDRKALRLARRNWKEATPSKFHCHGVTIHHSDTSE